MTQNLSMFNLFSTVVERDVDLMILEQLHCSPSFRLWLARNLLGEEISAADFEGAWCSVSDVSDGESDLVFVTKIGDSTASLGFLIENKIKAPFQPDQQQRYKLRGNKGSEAGWWGEFRTVLMAPQRYLDSCAGHIFDAELSYEALAKWFEAQPEDPNAVFKARLIRQAINHTSKPWDRSVDAIVSQFFLDYWRYLKEHFPDLEYKYPAAGMPAGSVWPHLCEHELPARVALIHKTEQGYVDLQFSGRSVEWLKQSCPAPVPSESYHAPSGKSSAIRINTPPVRPSQGFAPQEPAINAGLTAASCLIAWYRTHRNALGI